MNRCIDALVAHPSENSLRLITLEIIKIIAENLESVRVLWGMNGDMKFQEDMAQIFHDRFINLLPENKNGNKFENKFLYIYMINGCIGMIRKWIFEEFNRISPEEVTDMVLRITNANVLIDKLF